MSAGHHFAAQYARGGPPPCVRRRVHHYIATHLDQKITNDLLAQIAGLSTAHFCVVFKQTEGMSPHCYVLQYRVERAQQLLASTEMSLAEIADAVGFSNQSHCIQSFRKIAGVTPGDYRRCCLQDSVHSTPPWLILEINVSELLAIVVAHNVAGVQLLDGPRRREAAHGGGKS